MAHPAHRLGTGAAAPHRARPSTSTAPCDSSSRPDLLRPPLLGHAVGEGDGHRCARTGSSSRPWTDSERAAIGRFVMRTKEYLVAIRVRDGAPVPHDDEVPRRDPPGHRPRPAPTPRSTSPPSRSWTHAVELIERSACDGTRRATTTATDAPCEDHQEEEQGPDDRGSPRRRASARRPCPTSWPPCAIARRGEVALARQGAGVAVSAGRRGRRTSASLGRRRRCRRRGRRRRRRRRGGAASLAPGVALASGVAVPSGSADGVGVAVRLRVGDAALVERLVDRRR